jgi:hypothetical protein
MKRYIFVLFALSLIGLCHIRTGHSQQNLQIPQLLPDDTKLYHAFFLNSVAQQQANVNIGDEAKMISLAQSAAKRLNDLASQLQDYLTKTAAQTGKPKTETIQGFDAAQQLLDRRGIHDLMRGLTPKGWQEVRSYVNGSFRVAVNAGILPGGGK